jgi:transposase
LFPERLEDYLSEDNPVRAVLLMSFRKDNGEAIRKVCREFVVLCRRLELLSEASVAIDGSKFKAVNTRDRNFTQAKMQRRWRKLTRA